MPTLKLKKFEYVEYDVYCHDLSAFIFEVVGHKLNVSSLLSNELGNTYYHDRKYLVLPVPNPSWTKFCLYNEPVTCLQHILNGLCTDKFIESGTYKIKLFLT